MHSRTPIRAPSPGKNRRGKKKAAGITLTRAKIFISPSDVRKGGGRRRRPVWDRRRPEKIPAGLRFHDGKEKGKKRGERWYVRISRLRDGRKERRKERLPSRPLSAYARHGKKKRARPISFLNTPQAISKKGKSCNHPLFRGITKEKRQKEKEKGKTYPTASLSEGEKNWSLSLEGRRHSSLPVVLGRKRKE